MFGFIFTGTDRDYTWFKICVDAQVKDTELKIEKKDKDDIHCLMVDDPEKCFLVGMVLSEVYRSLGR